MLRQMTQTSSMSGQHAIHTARPQVLVVINKWMSPRRTVHRSLGRPEPVRWTVVWEWRMLKFVFSLFVVNSKERELLAQNLAQTFNK